MLRRVLPLIILLCGIGGFAALKASRPEPRPLAVEEKAWIVAVEPAHPATFAPTMSLFGRIDSPRVARLSAAITADVIGVEVLDGQRVTKAQTVVTLDRRDAELLLAQREAEAAEINAQLESEDQRYQNDVTTLERERMLVTLAKKEVRRATDLLKRNVGSHAELERARQAEESQSMALESRELAVREHGARRAQLEARLRKVLALADQAALELERTRITSPFDGRVTEVFVSPGDRVRIGDPLLSVYDTSTVEIRAQVPTRHVPRIRDGLREQALPVARVDVDGLRVDAILDRLTARVASGSGGVDCIFKVTGNTAGLPLGRTVELLVDLPPVHAAVAVPFEAVYANKRVFVLDNGRLKGVPIETVGERRDADGKAALLVKGAISEGDPIVITQLPNAVEGLRVKVAEN